MHLLKIIADVLEEPNGAWDRMLAMGVQQEVADHVLALVRLGGEVQLEDHGRWTTISYRNDL
jgi:hypothetical protein